MILSPVPEASPPKRKFPSLSKNSTLPGFVAAHNGLATVYELKGMHAEAVDGFLKAKSLTGSKPESLEALKRAYAAGGIKAYWQKELEPANEQLKVSPVGTQRMATIYTELGDRRADRIVKSDAVYLHTEEHRHADLL